MGGRRNAEISDDDGARRRRAASPWRAERSPQSKTYTFALVPKNTNNPFFDQALAGCKKAEKELNGAIKCLYIGPGEHGGGDEEAQIVADLITKKVDGIGVSPANAAAMAAALQGAKAANIPILTWDSDLLAKDKGAARRLYRHAQLRYRRQPRQARHADQAQGRHDLHPVGRRRGGQPQRAHAGHPRHARRARRARKRRATS